MKKYLLPVNPLVLLKSHDLLISQIGTKEATGHNDGAVEKYLHAIGLGKGNAYCLAGQYWCFDEAVKYLYMPAFQNPLPKTGLVKNLIHFAEKNAISVIDDEPQMHDLVCWRYPEPNIRGHVERIIVPGKENFITVGFNTSNGLSGSQREGDGVFRRQRSLSRKLGDMHVECLIGFEERE